MNKAMILVVEDDPFQRRLIKDNLEQEGYTVFETSSGKEARKLVETYPFDIAIIDFKLNGETGIEVIKDILKVNPLITPLVVTAFANIENAVEAIRQGAYDYIVKPIDFSRFLLVLERALERQKLHKEISILQSSLEEKFRPKNIISSSAKMEEVAQLISKAARSDATVLITGETGTGKELVARTIHFSSPRKSGPFLAVNIPSLPSALIESELFGAEKGSFTGAYERKTGKFEAAGGGTIFLDEIGDLTLDLQVKILRVLQEREFYRLGSSKPLKTDARIVAASNRHLEAEIAAGNFRKDLYYRLNIIRIEVPPLRERKDDILPLVDFFITKYSSREKKKITGISKEALTALLHYSFPGNVRELENIIERAIVFSDKNIITLDDLPVFLKEKNEADLNSDGLSLTEKVKLLEAREIKRALLEANGVKSKAAKKLGITERMLSYKIKTGNILYRKTEK